MFRALLHNNPAQRRWEDQFPGVVTKELLPPISEIYISSSAEAHSASTTARYPPRAHLSPLYGQGEASVAVVFRSCGSPLGSNRVSMLSAADVCPITFEPFTESGPMQPRVLPACGHTFSRVSLEQLLRLKENWLPVFGDGNRTVVGVSPLRCPLCAQPQKKGRVRSVEDCPPNWQLIYKLRDARDERNGHCSESKTAACRTHPRPCSARLKTCSFESAIHAGCRARVPLDAQVLEQDLITIKGQLPQMRWFPNGSLLQGSDLTACMQVFVS